VNVCTLSITWLLYRLKWWFCNCFSVKNFKESNDAKNLHIISDSLFRIHSLFLCNIAATKIKQNHSNNNNNNNNNNNSSIQLKFMQQQCRLWKFCCARCIKCNTQLTTQFAKFMSLTPCIFLQSVNQPTNALSKLQ
jgi:hypothetical protein